MRIGINTLALEPGYHGEQIYLRNVAAKIRELQPDTHFTFFTSSRNHEFYGDCERLPLDRVAEPLPGRPSVSNREFARTVAAAKADAVLTPLAYAPLRQDVPTVPYVMDLQFVERLLSMSRWRSGGRLRHLRRVCERAPSVIVPSVYIQRKLLDLLDVPLDKTIVAPLGVDAVFAEPQPCWVAKPYFLVVGATRAEKNIGAAAEAFKHFEARTEHNLIVAGHPAELEPGDWGPRTIRIQQCPTPKLAALYQHCDAFICPSLYEGSGVTVLEAMRAGAQVISGRVGGIPEVAGNAPLYCNTQSVAGIVEAIKHVLEFDDAERARRSQFMTKHAGEYTWEKCAWKTLQAFRNA